MRDALSILERCNQDDKEKITVDKIKELVGIPKLTLIMELMEAVIDSSVEKAIDVTEKILDAGNDINNLVWEMIKYVKDVLLYKSTGKMEIYNKEETEGIKRIAEKTTKQDLIDLICNLSEIENNIKLSTQKTIILQTGIIKLCNKVSRISNNENNNSNNVNNNSNLEERVTKIENFLKAGNFAKKATQMVNVTVPEMKEEIREVKERQKKIEGKLQDYWPKLVDDFKAQGKMFMYINLAGSIAKEINDMTLAIEFPKGINKVAKDFLERADNRKILKDTVHLACGKEMQIKYIDTYNYEQKMADNEFQSFAKKVNLPFNVID